MTLRWYDWSGLLGVSTILLAYFLLQAGAFALLISLLYAFNLSAFVMEAAWLVVSIYGIARGRRKR